MAKPAKPFKYREKWRAQLTLKNGQRLTRDFPVGQYDEAVRWLAEQRANADSAHEPQLGGPTQATLAQALELYAHLYTILKGGAPAELTRINHYLEAGGLQPLQLVREEGGFRIAPKPRRALPRSFAAHREERTQKRAKTYAQLAELARKPCGRIAKADIRAFMATMAQEGLSASTIQKEIALIKAMFNKAIEEWEWTTFKNPCAGIKLGGSVPRFVILSRDEREALFKALAECDNRSALALVLTLKTTLRERWKQVVSESTGCPIYLATLDEGVSGATLDKLAARDICLVVPERFKTSEYAEYKTRANVVTYRCFFDELRSAKEQLWLNVGIPCFNADADAWPA